MRRWREGREKGKSSARAGYLVGEAKRVRDVAPFCVRVGDHSRSVACVSVSTYLRYEGCEAKGTNASG